MATSQEIINVGTVANDGQGDPLRLAFTKTNNNFSTLFAAGGVSGISNGTSNINILDSGAVLISPQGVANVIAVTATGATVTGTLIGNPAISATGNVKAANFQYANGSIITGAQGTTGSQGATGLQGPSGFSNGIFDYKANASTTANAYPGNGNVVWDNSTQINSTKLYEIGRAHV